MIAREKYKIALAGGGTGGHIYPLIAIWEELRTASSPNKTCLDFVYLVNQGRREEKVAQEQGLPTAVIPFLGGMPRNLWAGGWFFRLLWSAFLTARLLRKIKPDLLVSTGGYAAAPALLAARLLKIPYILHNLDSCFGLANRVFAGSCRALTLGFPPVGELPVINGPILLTGNPIRRAFYQISDTTTVHERWGLNPRRKTLVVIGGSQGSQAINQIILESLDTLGAAGWQIVHQLGEQNLHRLSDRLSKLNTPHYQAVAYLEHPWELYAVADVLVGRGGALSLSEILTQRVPSAIIPLPKLAQNHQYHNAKSWQERGCLYLLKQERLSVESLWEQIQQADQNRDTLKENINRNLPQIPPGQALKELILDILHQI